MIVITDGEENASKTYKKWDVKNRVDRQQSTYDWKFIYLGANQDAIQEAASYGISWGNTMTYAAAPVNAANSWRSLTGSTVSYANTGSLRGFTKSERKEADPNFDPNSVPKTTTTNSTGA